MSSVLSPLPCYQSFKPMRPVGQIAWPCMLDQGHKTFERPNLGMWEPAESRYVKPDLGGAWLALGVF